MYNRAMSAAADKTAFFQRLGVDVWLRRRPREAAAEPRPARPSQSSPRVRPAPPPRRSQEQREPRRRAQAPAPPAPPVEAFRIRCFRYGRVFAALTEDAWPHRRYLLDVARAMNHFETAERHGIVFEWPQPGAAPDGAARAFRAFAGHQTRNGERALLSGQRVLDLLGSEATETGVVDGRVYVVPETPSAEAKKALWRLLSSLDAAPDS